jgi:hypothetical protein
VIWEGTDVSADSSYTQATNLWVLENHAGFPSRFRENRNLSLNGERQRKSRENQKKLSIHDPVAYRKTKKIERLGGGE